MPETRRKRKESRKAEVVTYIIGQIVYCFWKGIWWPGLVEEVIKEDVYQISFWNEEERITCNSNNLRDFQSDSDLIASSLNKKSVKKKKEKSLTRKKWTQLKKRKSRKGLQVSLQEISVLGRKTSKK